MTDENFEKFLKTTAQGYNVPPARTPREEMWKAIEAQRTAGPKVVYGGGSLERGTARRFETKVWWGAVAAGLVLVASGVGIGRWTAAPAPSTPVTSVAKAAPTVELPGVQATEPTATPGGLEAGGVSPRSALNPAEPSAPQRNPTGAAPSSPQVASRPGTNSAYQLVATHHLTDAEALLTTFRSRTPSDRQMDAQIGVWARDLLTNTRLLLDSPIGSDPQRRPLLEDLELVLVQIVQLSPGSTPQDRELIENTLQHDHVLTRLRTAIPAGPQRGS